MRRPALAFILLAVLRGVAVAHEARPAYLEVKETAPGRYDLLWRTPVLSGMRLPIRLKTPDGVRVVGEPVVQELSDSLLERRTLDAGPGGLAGKRIEFPGLQATITDVLVRVLYLDGRTWTTVAGLGWSVRQQLQVTVRTRHVSRPNRVPVGLAQAASTFSIGATARF